MPEGVVHQPAVDLRRLMGRDVVDHQVEVEVGRH
jgi:hypothetical protein